MKIGFVFLYIFVLAIVTAIAVPGLYHPCDPEMANKAAIIFIVASPIGHILLLEFGRFAGLIKKRNIVLELVLIIGVIFASILFAGLVNFNRVCVGTTSSAKNQLVNGVKECIVMDLNNQSTNFSDVTSFSAENINKNRNFEIIKTEKDSCFNARAVPKKEIFTWFEVNYNPDKAELIKTCGDSSKPGCDEGNTW